MTRLICATLLCCSFSTSGFAQKSSNIDSTQIRAIVDEFFQVFSQHDMKYVDRTCTPDFELYDVGLVWNVDSVRTYVSKYPKPYNRENKFRFLQFNFRKNVAWASYWNTGIFHQPDGKQQSVRWLESVILERRKGKWWLVQMHSTRVR
jgi:hypothetical protein